MTTAAHRERNKRYRQTQDQIAVNIPKGARAGIKEHAAKKGKSLNSYIVELIEQDIGFTMRKLSEK